MGRLACAAVPDLRVSVAEGVAPPQNRLAQKIYPHWVTSSFGLSAAVDPALERSASTINQQRGRHYADFVVAT